MDSDGWLQLILLLILFISSAYFSKVETAYASMNKIRMRILEEDGDKRARRALYIHDNFDRALTTILVGNDIVNALAASLTTLFVTRSFGEKYVGLSAIILTVIMFLFCEMLPKTYAKDNSETVALRSSASLRFFMIVLRPLSAVFSFVSKGIGKLMHDDEEPTITKEELYEIIETIDDESQIQDDKKELVQSALQFDDISAQSILTPRVDLVSIDIEDSHADVLNMIREEKYSRYPVYEGSIDNIVGVLQARKYLKQYILQGSAEVREIMSEPYYCHKKMPIDELLRDMRLKRVHMAVVSDDYGGTMGIVTVEDILEELVGEIWDEDDEVTEDFKKIGGGRCEVSTNMLVNDVFDRMGIDFSDNEQRYETIGSWVLAHLQDNPDEGDEFTDNGVDVRVLNVDSNRITKVLITPEEKDDTSDEEEAGQ